MFELPIATRTERFLLRAWRPNDAPALRAALDASLAHLRPWVPMMKDEPRSMAATVELVGRWVDDFAAGRAFRWAVWDGEALVGEVMLFGRRGPGILEVGYWIHVDHVGRGIATEVSRVALAMALAQPGIGRVVFACARDNHASSAVPRKLGAYVSETVTADDGAFDLYAIDRAKRASSQVKALWDDKAHAWHEQVGDDGDANRIWNSDPVLWRFLGAVDGLDVLDAGCGTGYLSRKLAARGARVVAVDFSDEMVRFASARARELGVAIDVRVDSVSELATIADASVDKVVCNYVLQDLPDLRGASAALSRVLRSGGTAVVVVTHPCFPQSDATQLADDGSVTYRWRTSYFEEHEVDEAPWKHFTSPFVYYHRPLSGYWRAFRGAGFDVVDFDEPVVARTPPAGYPAERLPRSRMRPNSAAFALRKPPAPTTTR